MGERKITLVLTESDAAVMHDAMRHQAAATVNDAMRARINNLADRITTARRYDHGTLGKGRSLTRRRG